MDCWTVFYNMMWTLVILFFTWVIYDWLSDLAWMRKYSMTGPIPWPLLKNLPYIMTASLDKLEASAGKKYGPCSVSIMGTTRSVYVSDINLLKKIFIEDHVKFQNRFRMEILENYPMGYSLLALRDEAWKRVRSIVTPSFSSGKIKLMVNEVNYCGELLTKGLESKAQNGETIDVWRHFGCYTMDVIAATAFGLKTDSYNNPEGKFVSLAQKVLGESIFSPFLIVASYFPRLCGILTNKFGVSFYFPKDSLTFFTDVLKELIEERKKRLDKKNVDLLQLMLNAELDDTVDKELQKTLDIHELLGQGVTVFIAAYETTTSLLSYLSYILATHPDVQEKLIEEIDEHIHDVLNDTNYGTVMGLTYLDQVINETLRIYPPVARHHRSTTNDQDVQLDGYWFPADVDITFSIYHIHHSPEFYPEPEKFKPERFTTEEKAKRDPFTFLPFGHGPRNCIGMRLGLLEAKIAVVHILKQVKFVKCAETQIPLELSHENFLKPKKPIKVGLQLR